MLTNKTKNVAIFSLIFFLVSGGVLGFTVYKIISLGAELQKQSEIVARNNVLQKKYTELLSVLKQTERERETLTSYLLTEQKTVDFLTEIEQIAKTQGVELSTDSLSVSKPDGKKFDELVITFSIKGSEKRVKNMIQTLETLPYSGHVTQLSLIRTGSVPATTSGFSGNIELTLSLLSI